MNKIRANGKSFVDESGRERIFNGVNFVYKGCEPSDDGTVHYSAELNEEKAAALAKRGMNIVRLGVTWAGVEPEMCRYNDVYLAEVKAAVKACEKYGIYVYIDFHQDLYSHFCDTSGDGAPAWAFTKPVKQRKTKLIWAEGYFLGRAVHSAFDDFWANAEVRGRGLQDRFCDMLRYVVKFFSDCENIMAYDVFNEPFPGTPGGKIFRNLVVNGVETLLVSKRVDRAKLIKDAVSGKIMDALSVADDPIVYHGVIDNAHKILKKFDTESYYPFIKRCCEAVRTVSPDVMIFLENSYYSNLGIPYECPRVVYDNGEAESNLAFACHGYDITVDTPLTNSASPYRVDFIFNEHSRSQKRLDMPVLVGEWGGMVPGSEEYPALEHLVDKFDTNKWSQTYWHYHPQLIGKESRIMDILARPYPMAVAGKIKSYGYDRKAKTFTLRYSCDGSVKTPTLIYLPSEPKNILSTKKYFIKEENGACILSVYAGKGECIVTAEW